MAQVQREPAPSLQDRAREFDPLIVESARRHGIDPRILRAVCFIESRFRVEATSSKGARGLMQFMPTTAARYGLRNPYEPRAAIDAGARYLRDLLRRFDGRVDLALAAYNAGEGAVESFQTGKPLTLSTGKIVNPRGLITGGIPPYRETQEYVRSAASFLIHNSMSGMTRLTSLKQSRGHLLGTSKSDQPASKTTSVRRQSGSLFIEVE
ncbi:MAG TPA: lytic transglycosylase domain-containing protein [Pyrinomonadaceae bacterium]|jgi:soluble lytic murein transglycosylase-like protein|nr:lytic transglycosylase domain-containing protein [Pyrinomonadaceae bacterium]